MSPSGSCHAAGAAACARPLPPSARLDATLTTELTPDNITAMVTKYLEAENVDVSQLSSAQIEAIVSKFAEATGCDKSELLQNFTAYIA